ncbi:DUF4405 domain-containing protein [Hwanghaeella grinnelliae]|uniref:DUF4405 domain-containing protein n=2 Tax=Hwanghaeella grinnelliae TaxID=2500179 RepID=A0A437QR06_9PROT|nr:DUF4405 domain-containing protein [Hwanghaeella grinnelliae]
MISGIALFFHWAPSAFHGMHEWLSIALLVPFALHVWKNWRGLVNYLRNRTLFVALAASLVVAVPFAAPAIMGQSGGNPAFKAVGLMTQASLTEIAPILGSTPDGLMKTLSDQGHSVASADQTLAAIATGSGIDANRLLFAVIQQLEKR